jgi:hypothetical protein
LQLVVKLRRPIIERLQLEGAWKLLERRYSEKGRQTLTSQPIVEDVFVEGEYAGSSLVLAKAACK